MGFISSIWGAIGGRFASREVPESTSPEKLREQHGFADFDGDMERLRDYDPATALDKCSEQQAKPAPPAKHRKR